MKRDVVTAIARIGTARCRHLERGSRILRGVKYWQDETLLRAGIRLLAFALSVLLLGCQADGPVELFVSVKTDLTPGVEFHGVLTEVFDSAPRAEERALEAHTRTRRAATGEPFGSGLLAAEFVRLPLGTHYVRVRLLDRSSVPVLQQLAIVTLRDASEVTIVLLRSCRDTVCPGPLDDPSHAACFGGECGDPRCTPETPEYCPPPMCADSSDCVPPSAECAEARCEEGRCFSMGRSGACEVGQWCSPELGCLSVSDPCEGVTCEGGGECVARHAMPTCLCDDGRWVIGTRCDAATGCLSSECASGHVCRFDTGRCGSVESLCGLPPSEGGSVRRYEQCSTEEPCEDGLFCAAKHYDFDPSSGEYGIGEGVCMPTCDPCAPSCPSGRHCVALGGRPGGFCLSGPLIELGNRCGAHQPYLAMQCATNAICAVDVRVCEALCRPSDPPVGGSRVGYSSDDCRAGELCMRPVGPGARDSFVCRRGEIVSVGHACDEVHYCEPGADCSAVPLMGPVGLDVQSYFFCSHACPCPDGIDCFDIRLSGPLCVPDHALPYHARCAEDRNCSEDLVCRSGYCQLP